MQSRRPLWSIILRPLRPWNEELVYGFARRARPTSADGTVVIDAACRRCGYNLRTLHVHARCPECDMQVATSVRGDELIYCDPAWLAKLALGGRLLLVSWMAIPLMVLAAAVYRPLAALVVAAAGAGMLMGTWMLTIPDPAGTGEAWYGRTRRLARWLPFAAAAAPLLEGLGDAAPTGAVPRDVAFTLLSMVIYLALLAGGGAMLAMLAFVWAVAATRITDSALAHFAARVFRVMAAALAVFPVGVVVVGILGRHTPARGAAGCCWSPCPASSSSALSPSTSG